MAYWVFKITDQNQYPDRVGKEYIFNNTHSVRVEAGDSFIYLEKRGHGRLRFVGSGEVAEMADRQATREEQSSDKVTRMFHASLRNFKPFATHVEISATKVGRKNRERIGLSNLNEDGLSRSV